jgi:hypothetical protein
MILNLRIGELNKVFAHRYGGDRATWIFPDDDAGRDDLDILIRHCAESHPAKPARIIKLRAPWMSKEESTRRIDMAFAYPHRWRSATLGRRLNYAREEWLILKTQTIGPVGLSNEERKRISARDRMERRRRRKGAKPRALYEGKSLSRQKPWAKDGISRRTWERRRKAQEACRKCVTNKVCKGVTDLRQQGREARKSEKKGFDGRQAGEQQERKERTGYELDLSRFQKMARN